MGKSVSHIDGVKLQTEDHAGATATGMIELLLRSFRD
jgi:hypothetical protein